MRLSTRKPPVAESTSTPNWKPFSCELADPSAVPARGDQLGAGGQIIKTRDAVVKEYYNNNVATESSGVAKKASTPVADVIVEPQPKKAAKKVKKPEITKEEQDMFNDFDDDWIEDKDGNFVQKGK